MARAMDSLSSFGQWMSSVAHNLTGNFRCSLLYQGSTFASFLELVDLHHRVDDRVCISRASSIRGLSAKVGGGNSDWRLRGLLCEAGLGP